MSRPPLGLRVALGAQPGVAPLGAEGAPEREPPGDERMGLPPGTGEVPGFRRLLAREPRFLHVRACATL
ncbi:Hypothetical protein AA314_00591 [Archangium gephyra]|uniref:Uncharacterized protein n=1 Tax=Archangium gephyra TaxID=48 RepID=A0AAC8TAI9_9BACT|nr:Hypothetical protein AA314_00591 [Archangium gephyra]